MRKILQTFKDHGGYPVATTWGNKVFNPYGEIISSHAVDVSKKVKLYLHELDEGGFLFADYINGPRVIDVIGLDDIDKLVNYLGRFGL